LGVLSNIRYLILASPLIFVLVMLVYPIYHFGIKALVKVNPCLAARSLSSLLAYIFILFATPLTGNSIYSLMLGIGLIPLFNNHIKNK